VADELGVLAPAIRQAVRAELTILLRASDPDYVFFLELRHRGVFLRAAPIDVSQIVRENLLERFATTVLTSATLTVEGTFDYLRGRLGIRRATEIRLASEFDFRTQAVLYLSTPSIPTPFGNLAITNALQLTLGY
jgi:ATP-dependent DNA helicase DinG